MTPKQAPTTLKKHRGEDVSSRFLAPKVVRAISDTPCPRSVRLALGVSQGFMGLLLARAVGRTRPWSRWTVRDWEDRDERHPMTDQACEAYRRLLMGVLHERGLCLRVRGPLVWQVVRFCRRGHVYQVRRMRDRCPRCARYRGVNGR